MTDWLVESYDISTLVGFSRENPVYIQDTEAKLGIFLYTTKRFYYKTWLI